MKNTILGITLLGLMLPLFVSAQMMEGEIHYNEKVNLHKRLTGDRERFKEMIPEHRTFPKVLYFTQEAARYEATEREIEENQDIESMGPGGPGGGRSRFMMRFSGATGGLGGITFMNLQDGTQIDQRDFMDKRFLVSGNPVAYQWKMSPEQKEINGYQCMKAVHTDTAQTVVAWFTMQIPVSSGPDRLSGLPGLILEADINDGEKVITVHEIKAEAPDPKLLVAPKKGKKVTEEEFRTIMREKMQEMREMRRQQGGGRRPGTE